MKFLKYLNVEVKVTAIWLMLLLLALTTGCSSNTKQPPSVAVPYVKALDTCVISPTIAPLQAPQLRDFAANGPILTHDLIAYILLLQNAASSKEMSLDAYEDWRQGNHL